jgi:hypothetical protein
LAFKERQDAEEALRILTRERYLELSQTAREMVDHIRQETAAAIATDGDMTEAQALEGVIDAHEAGYLRIAQRGNQFVLVPCMPDGRLVFEA